ncbi:MAG: hypothetical protein JSR17_13880, partial [Proteobacteria bacterium]|nr:hypothetical protein [Pseudomonadota bacterium]
MRRVYQPTLLCLLTAAFNNVAWADPTIGVARLSDVKGDVSFLSGSVNEWVTAKRNRALIPQDTLWNDIDSYASLQVPNATLCSGQNSLVSILNIDDFLVQLQLTQGTLDIFIGHYDNDQEYEISTPNLVFHAYQPGHYRITVDSEGKSTTTVNVLEGGAQIYGQDASYLLNQDDAFQFFGKNLKTYQVASRNTHDDLERWCVNQLPSEQNNAPTNVSYNVIGHADLDQFGSWQQIPDYGIVWSPKGVSANFVPYREGNWVWIEPWGWTWVSDEPWGFAPYHYGRWANINNKWYWVPGQSAQVAVYTPAQVAFMMVDNGSIVGWFPLAPGEIYWPSFYASLSYFASVNLSNTSLSNEMIKKAYENPPKDYVYQYQNNSNALTALTLQSFTDAMLASKMNIVLSKDLLADAYISPMADVTPTPISMQGQRRGTLKIPAQDLIAMPTLVLNQVPASVARVKDKSFVLASAKEPKASLAKAVKQAKASEDKARLLKEKERFERQKREQALIRAQEQEAKRYLEQMRRQEEARRQQFYKEEERRAREAYNERQYREYLLRKEAARQERLRRDEERRKLEALEELKKQAQMNRQLQEQLQKQQIEQAKHQAQEEIKRQAVEAAKQQAEIAKEQAARQAQEQAEAKRQAVEAAKQQAEIAKEQAAQQAQEQEAAKHQAAEAAKHQAEIAKQQAQ